jgi:signal transduction histidine kinase
MRVVAAIAIPVALALLLSVLLVLNQRGQARVQADSAARADVASAVTQVRTEVRNEITAATAGAQPGESTVTLDAIGRTSVSPDNVILARDGGTAVLDDNARPPSIIVPVYRGHPSTTTARRASIVAYRIAPLTLESVMTTLAPDSGGLVVRGPHHLVSAVPGAPPAGARTYSVDMDLTGFPGWAVQAWRADPGIPGVAWFWVAGLVVVIAALTVLVVSLQRRTHLAVERREQLERDRALITGLAPVLQASLDIGEVIPAVTSHLADGLGLAGLSLSRPTDAGERQLFAWGTGPDNRVKPGPAVPNLVSSGATHAVSLARGGRVLGVLRVVTGRDMNRDDLLALTAASELLGSTLANAEAFAQQQELVDRMRSVDELKTVFLATASHELRTPVTAIVGFSALLRDGWETMSAERKHALVERLLDNGRRLESLIEQLLDFSQLERGLPRTTDELIDLGRTVERIVSAQAEIVAEHELRLDLADDCMIRGSVAAVERIVTNLVGNAAKYSPKGSKVTVTVRPSGDRVQLLVDDEGPGVPEEDRERVFSRFYRGRADSVSRTRGAGIGLAIVSEYAASLSGRASVGRAPSGGARFSISLPAVRVLAVTTMEGESDVVVS